MRLRDDAEEIKEKLNEEEQVQVRIALFGRSGVGKSSIINKLVGRYVAETGEGIDTTLERNDYEWNGLVLTDLPGYNTEMHPSDTYFEKFSILNDFDLFICVFTNRIYESDLEFYKKLRSNGKPCIFVRGRTDEIWDEKKTFEELKQEIIENTLKQLESYNEKIIFVSCRNNKGFDLLSVQILSYLDEAKKKRWYKSAKAYSHDFLEKKKKQVKQVVIYHAGISAANGFNPIPGSDIAVDIGVLLNLFRKIRKMYGLSDSVLQKYKSILSPASVHLINNVVKYGTKQGLLLLLKKYAGKEAIRRFSRFVPLVGQTIAASAGFMITKTVGDTFLNDCHNLAKEILDDELKQ